VTTFIETELYVVCKKQQKEGKHMAWGRRSRKYELKMFYGILGRYSCESCVLQTQYETILHTALELFLEWPKLETDNGMSLSLEDVSTTEISKAEIRNFRTLRSSRLGQIAGHCVTYEFSKHQINNGLHCQPPESNLLN